VNAPVLDDQKRKKFETLRAQAALLGATLILFDNDLGHPELALTRWCFTKAFSLAQLDELEELLKRMGAAA
jgi:hypothetical protein